MGFVRKVAKIRTMKASRPRMTTVRISRIGPSDGSELVLSARWIFGLLFFVPAELPVKNPESGRADAIVRGHEATLGAEVGWGVITGGGGAGAAGTGAEAAGAAGAALSAAGAAFTAGA